MNLIIGLGLVTIQLCLIAVCFGSQSDDERIRSLYDPNHILDDNKIAILKTIPEENQRSVAKAFVNDAAKIANKDTEIVNKDTEIADLKKYTIFQHFQCGVNVAKNVIQFFNFQYHKDPSGKLSGIRRIALPSHEYRVSMPKFYKELVEEQMLHDTKTEIADVENMMYRWYFFISKSENEYATNMRTLLDLYLTKHSDKFNKNVTALYITFCASVCRSNRFFNFIYHVVLAGMHVSHFDMNDDNAFFNYLFKMFPDYYFQIDDISFINILLSSREIVETRKVNKKNQMNFLRCKTPKNKDAIIPFSDYCPPQKITALTEHYALEYPSTTTTKSPET